MGKLEEAKKIAAKLAGPGEKMSKEAAEAILKRIDTVEAATALKGAEKQQYLDALDTVYGDKTARMAKDFPENLKFEQKYRDQSTAPNMEGNSPLSNLTKEGTFPEDIYSKKAQQYYGHGDTKIDPESIKIIQAMKDKPDELVSMYRTAPKGTKQINPGDWVSINKEYAIRHGENRLGPGNYELIEQKVPAKQLYNQGDIHEFGYDPRTRTQEANFDPRFKDSPNILAATGSQKPSFGLQASPALQQIAKNISDKYLVPAFNDYVVKPAISGYENVVQPVLEGMEYVNEQSGRNEASKQITGGVSKAIEQAPRALDRFLAPVESLYKTPEQMQANQQKSAEAAKFAQENISPIVSEVLDTFIIPDVTNVPMGRAVSKVMKMAKDGKPGLKVAEKLAAKEGRVLNTAEKLAAKKPEEVLVLGDGPVNLGTLTDARKPERGLGKVDVIDTAPVRKEVGLPNYGSVTTPDMKPKVVAPPKSNENLDSIIQRYKALK